MGRKTHNKDWVDSEIKKHKAENTKLRRQVSKLRKVISRIDLDHYQFIKDLLESQEKQDQDFSQEQKKKGLENRWKCYDCEDGILRLVTVMKAGEPYYLRKCDSCGKKTKTKKYTEDIEGV